MIRSFQMSLAAWALVPFAALLGGGNQDPDAVKLKNGVERKGRVVFEDDERLILRRGSAETEFEQSEIETVESLERSMSLTLNHARLISNKDVRSLRDAARICEDKNLPGLADLLHLKILIADPLNDVAHEALGHRKRNTEWTGPLNGKWHRWRELSERRQDWNDAWEFETTHYTLRSSLKLESAVNSALDLERFYLFFHETIGSTIGLRGVSEPLKVHLYGDQDSYIQLGDNRPGWYDPQRQLVNVDGSRKNRRLSLMHEATHQLLAVGKDGRADNAQRVPAWLGEGLAEYLAYSTVGVDGSAQFRVGRLATIHMYKHADEEEPESLNAILALEVGDFLNSKRANLRYSQAYSLVHFCLHGDDERYRDDFFEFLRLAQQGKTSSSGFKKLVTKNPKEFEQAWTRYVASVTGGR